jgi:branched-chain amino acid transport system substrate-binding protein
VAQINLAMTRRWLGRATAAAAATVFGVSGLVGGVIICHLHRRAPVQVAVGIDLPLVPGAAIDPSDRNTADLYLEEHPRSRIRLVNHFNPPDPAGGPASIAALKRDGVRFFITTQASSHAVPSLPEFADGQALAINVSAVSDQLSGKDDFFLRVVPDVTQEQQAIARELSARKGGRLLVLQDTGNRAWTDPAFQIFNRELAHSGRWQVVRRELAVAQFNPERDRQLLVGDYDALYMLAGAFLPVIGNITQLFHQLHPDAPILLTPWARSPAILESAGPAARQMLIASPFAPRDRDPQINAYLQRFERRFGYKPYAMGLSTRQALELLDRALASGASTPAAVKRYLLSKPEHPTSFGPVRFDANGDVQGNYVFFRPSTSALP